MEQRWLARGEQVSLPLLVSCQVWVGVQLGTGNDLTTRPLGTLQHSGLLSWTYLSERYWKLDKPNPSVTAQWIHDGVQLTVCSSLSNNNLHNYPIARLLSARLKMKRTVFVSKTSFTTATSKVAYQFPNSSISAASTKVACSILTQIIVQSRSPLDLRRACRGRGCDLDLPPQSE